MNPQFHYKKVSLGPILIRCVRALKHGTYISSWSDDIKNLEYLLKQSNVLKYIIPSFFEREKRKNAKIYSTSNHFPSISSQDCSFSYFF